MSPFKMYLSSLLLLLLFSLIVFGEKKDSDSCAYAAMGMIGTPLGSCSVYSMKETTSMSYSSDYTFDGTTLSWNYYNDLNCKSIYKSYEMDDVMMAIHHLNIQTVGLGDKCHTVDIKVKGSYSQLIDDCDDNIHDTDDYYSRSYVIDECISSEIEQYSSILLCDKDKIYFNYYSQCTDCSCSMQQYIYEYYGDKDKGCYDVKCNSKTQILSSDVSTSSVIVQKTDAQFIRNLITKTENTLILPRKMEMVQINKKLKQIEIIDASQMSFWIYAAFGTLIFMVFCAICKYINSFKNEYLQI